MFRLMVMEKTEKFWIAVHVLIGLAAGLSRNFLIAWVYLVYISAFFQLLRYKNKDSVLVSVLVYALGFEQLNRSVHGWPLLPYEMGKYLSIAVVLFGLLYPARNSKKVIVGSVMLVLSLPAFFLLPDGFRMADVVFNYFGLFSLCISITFFSKQTLTYSQVLHMFKVLLFPVISFAIYIMLRQSQTENVQYGLSANYETSGGTATNQVATILGFGFAVLALVFLTRQKVFKTRYVDKALMFIFLFRALITFSRGGIVAALLAIILVLILPKTRNIWANRQIIFRKINPVYYIYSVGFILITFLIVNSVTGNFLLLRYQGYNAHSIVTGKRDLRSITSSRSEIFESDLVIFANNPMFGVGIGQSRYWRTIYGFKVAALPHSEPSRMLSEHGLFGVGMVLIFLFYPFYRVFAEKSNYRRAYMTIFFSIAVLSSFHVAMRTMITPLAFGLACINIIPDAPFRYSLRSNTAFTKAQKQDNLAMA